MSQRVLVLDANQRSALAVTRSLGSHGVEVVTADVMPHTLAGASRFSGRSLCYPDPAAAPAEFLSTVAEWSRSLSLRAILPTTDITTMLLAAAQSPGGIPIGCASAVSYEALTDKAKLVQLAQALDIPVPRTHVFQGAAAALQLASALPLPLVVKPSRSRYTCDGRIHSTQVRVAESAQELRDILESAGWIDHIPGMLQQFIPGHGAGAFALGDGTDVVAWFAHRRLREKPPSGGVSVLCESVPLDPALQSISARLLQAARWFGPAMIEFRVAADGTPYLMEVNGRFWGSLQLSIDSGIDFPWLLYRLLLGERPANQSYANGRRLRWLLGDVDNLLIQARTQRSGRARAAFAFAKSFFDPAGRQEIFRWSDPKPALREARGWLKALA